MTAKPVYRFENGRLLRDGQPVEENRIAVLFEIEMGVISAWGAAGEIRAAALKTAENMRKAGMPENAESLRLFEIDAGHPACGEILAKIEVATSALALNGIFVGLLSRADLAPLVRPVDAPAPAAPAVKAAPAAKAPPAAPEPAVKPTPRERAAASMLFGRRIA